MSIRKLDVSRTICTHLLSDRHTEKHRMAVGGVIVIVGVMVSKIPVGYQVLHIFLDAGGYFIHGVGAIPFVEHLIAKARRYESREK